MTTDTTKFVFKDEGNKKWPENLWEAGGVTSPRIAETLPSSTDKGGRRYKAALAYAESQYVAQTFSVIKNFF